MADALEQVVDDLQAEHASLAAIIDNVPFERWEKATHAPGWAIRDQVTHLAYFDEAAMTAINDPEKFVADAKRMNEQLADPAADPAYLSKRGNARPRRSWPGGTTRARGWSRPRARSTPAAGCRGTARRWLRPHS